MLEVWCDNRDLCVNNPWDYYYKRDENQRLNFEIL